MSGNTNPTEMGRVFDPLSQLEQLAHDEYLREMNKKADDIEWQLSFPLSSPSAVDLMMMRQKLNGEWHYMNQDVPVAGRIMTPKQSTNLGLPEYQIEVIDNDETLISTGFMFVALQDDPLDEMSVAYKVAYAFMRDGQQCAMMRDDFIGTFPDRSYEMAEKRLLYHHRAEIECINARLARSEVPTIMDFSDYTLDVLMYARYNEGYVGDVETYIYAGLRFDQVVPYYVVYGDDTEQLSVIAQPEKLTILPITDDDSESPRRHRPYIQLSIYGATPTTPNVHVCVPIESLHQFTPLRMAPRRTQTD